MNNEKLASPDDERMVLRGEARITLTEMQSEAYLAELAFVQKRYIDTMTHLGMVAWKANKMIDQVANLAVQQ